MFLNPSCWPLLRYAGEWFAQIKGPLPYGCGRAAAFVGFSRLFFPLPFLLCSIGILIFSKGWIRLFFLCRTTQKSSFVPADVNLGCEMSLWPSLTVHTLLTQVAQTLSFNKPNTHAENPSEGVRWWRRCVWPGRIPMTVEIPQASGWWFCRGKPQPGICLSMSFISPSARYDQRLQS